jgi:Cft2 family RNA processing exonuclease
LPRTRSTPFSAQLARYLRNLAGASATFSARTLAEEFDVPPRQKRTTTIGQLHRALQLAFSRGEIITFADTRGLRLREEEFTVHGSAAVEHPYIFATPGTPSPADGYEPVTYEQLNAMPSPDGEHTVEADAPDALADADDHADDDAEQDEPGDAARASELTGRLVRWEATAPAPAWLPDELLRIWVALPRVQSRWRARLDQAAMRERLVLIRAGIKRKGDFTADSVTAGQAAQLCRENESLWEQCAMSALKHYIASDEALESEDLPAFADDPLAFADAHQDEVSGAALALTGALLDLDDDAMELIAMGAVEGIAEAKADALEARLRHRAETLQAELDEVRQELRSKDEATKRAEGEAQQLGHELERLRDAARHAGSIDEALAAERAGRQQDLSRIAELEARLASAEEDRERALELTARLQAAEQAQEELTARSEQLTRERELRAEAEAQIQEQLRRIRGLTAQIRDTAQASVELPMEDADALLRALGRPIGQAAGRAADRLAAGAADAADQRLLQLAAAYGALAIPAAPHTREPDAVVPKTSAAEARVPDEPRSPVTSEAATPLPATAPTAAHDDGARTDGAPAEQHGVTPATEAAAAGAEAPAAGPEPDPDDGASASGPVRRRQRVQPSPFTVRPIGGAEEIGGSAMLVQTRDGASVLLDAGQRVRFEYGGGDVSEFHYGIPGVEHLHGVLISHAHIDHVGSLPLVHQYHSELQDAPVPVWMSEPTLDLTRIMLEDSAKIQYSREQTARALAETDFAPDSMRRAYTRRDVDTVLSEEVVRIAQRAAPIAIPDTDLVAKFLPVAHVLGSCAIHLKDTATGATLLYTGDLGPFTDPQHTLPDFGGPSGLDGADIIIMESTYGALNDEEREGRRRRLAGRERAVQLLADAAGKAIERGGFVLLPSFGLGRTQEIATIIGKERGHRLPDGPIYLGGMGARIIDVYDKYGTARRGNWAVPGGIPEVKSVTEFLSDNGSFDEAVTDILAAGEPGYIIASPAMVSGGWSRGFLEQMAGDDRHAVVFTGYLPRHAGGIPNLSRLHTNAQLRLADESITIRAQWERAYGLSAHAPGRDLRRFAEEISRGRERVTFGTVHGEPEGQRALAADIDDTIENATASSLQRNTPWPRRA